MLDVAKDNWSLTEYLIGQVLQTSAHQFEMLKQFYPQAQHEGLAKKLLQVNECRLLNPQLNIMAY